MTTEEFEIVPLASVPAKTRKEGRMSLALRALGPGQAIRMAIPTEKVAHIRGAWLTSAGHTLGPRSVRTRYVDGYLYIWLRGEGDA